MSQTKRVSGKGPYLSQAIPGYRGYSPSRFARETDQIFSEEVLSKLSETAATVARMKRLAGDQLDPDTLASLDAIADKAQGVAKILADIVPREKNLLAGLERRKSREIVELDSAILEKIGNINQALSVMELEGGVGISSDELDSVCELLDDLASDVRKRAGLITGLAG